jgi:predicted component of type VI protein secretion system
MLYLESRGVGPFGEAMKQITFQVLEGIDKGRVFRDLAIPVTIGREEGNMLRLNDERVSRFHAKVQIDGGDVIITDLDSTNGTRVNGAPVQIRRIRPGDQISLGRSVLLFGSHAEIGQRCASIRSAAQQTYVPLDKTLGDPAEREPDPDFVSVRDLQQDPPTWQAKDAELPPLPQKLTPAQAARIAEILDYLHRGLACAAEKIAANEEGSQVRLPFPEWQKIQAVEMLLARYLRAIAEPETLVE